MIPPNEPKKPDSNTLTSDSTRPESKTSAKSYHKKVSLAEGKEPTIPADMATQRTETATHFGHIEPVDARNRLYREDRPVPTTPEKKLDALLSTDGELATIYRTNLENHYISETDRALKALKSNINDGKLNNDLSDRKSLNNYKNLITNLNLPKDLRISLTMPSGEKFCLIPANMGLMSANNLKELINTAIQLTSDIRDTRAIPQSQLENESTRILADISQLLLKVNEPEPFKSRHEEIKKPPICITTPGYNASPDDVKSPATSEAELTITTNNTPEKVETLVLQLKAHRKKVQSFIQSTQHTLLKNGPDTQWIESCWPELECRSLKLARQLVNRDSEHPNTELANITAAIEDDIAGLKKYIKDAAEYDFRSGQQYLKQVEIYAELATRLSSTQPENKSTTRELTELVEKKRAIAQTDGKTAQCVPDAIKELNELHRKLKKRFDAGLFKQELIKILEENSESFSSRLHIYRHGQWHEVVLEYTPAAAMRLYGDHANTANAAQGSRDPFKKSYDEKIAISMLRDSPHAVNMLAYTMMIDGQEAARHIRVGCPYAYREKGENIDQVTDQRLDEIFTALLLHNHEQALKDAMKNPDHKPIELDCLYLNLLSPDHLRDSGAAGMIGMPNEKKWVEQLHQRLINMAGTERNLTVHYADGKSATVKIRPQPIMFVAPCNNLALLNRKKTLLSKAIVATANTWETALNVNKASLIQLLGEEHKYGGLLGKKLPTLSAPEQKKAKLLANDLWALYNTKGSLERVAEQIDPFYFSQKLKELSTILGLDWFTGCKSNKDRTGLSEAYQQSVLTSDSPELTEQFMVYGGHMMIQMRNTGLPGYKLDGSQAKQLDGTIFSKLTRH